MKIEDKIINNLIDNINKLSDSSLILLTLIIKGEFQKRLEKEKNNDKMNLVC